MSAKSTNRRDSSGHNLPAEVASFVGRQRDAEELKDSLRRVRLLTLTGPGGSGKTRLALHVASGVIPSFADGVWLVQLAPLTDSKMLVRAVATALGVRGISGQPLLATLAAALASRRLLLVLDNCEHMIGACARLAETLLGACPHLRILATSREPLRVAGEVVRRVPSLELPEDPLPDFARLAEIEAVALFVERAHARSASFTLTADNAPAVAAICRRLEGLPLAIELAAAQTGALTPEQIANRLDDALRFLGSGSRTVPRQETLRATLDWSYALLSSTEQVLFRRLAVFAGTFDTDAAEEICSGADIERADALSLLAALVEKSLVEPQEVAGTMRYRLLEPVRQYALEHLAAKGETAQLARTHAAYFAQLAEALEPSLMSGERTPALDRLAAEQTNLRVALDWSRHAIEVGDMELGLRLAGALWFFWNLRGEVSEGLHWIEALLARGHDAEARLRAKGYYAAAELGWLAGHVRRARERAEEAVTLFRRIGDKRGLAYALQSLPLTVDNPGAQESVAESLRLFAEVGDGWGFALALAAPDLYALMTDDESALQGESRLEDALARWRALRDDWGTAQVLNMLGDLARSQGRDELATARYAEALVLLRRQGMMGTVPSLLHNLAYQALRRGKQRDALRLFRESLTMFRDQGDRRGMADCLTGVACVLGSAGQPDEAAKLFGLAEASRETMGATIWPSNTADYEHGLSVVRHVLEESALQAAWVAGRALPLDQTVEELLDEVPSHHSAGTLAASELTAREREVAILVAQGMTNRQIGLRLFITEGTARLHVKHILQKLGFASRAQIAAWTVKEGLVGTTAVD